jgi:hypothetical protein
MAVYLECMVVQSGHNDSFSVGMPPMTINNLSERYRNKLIRAKWREQTTNKINGWLAGYTYRGNRRSAGWSQECIGDGFEFHTKQVPAE